MRIGYLFRGYLGDVKWDAAGNEVSTPDGNATYSWSIEHECERRKHKLIPLGENLDAPAAASLGPDLFKAFSGSKRAKSYERMLRRGWSRLSERTFPALDLVLVEWRWPIPGRNTPADRESVDYRRDLERQWEVLRHYSNAGTPIVVWDLDHKLTELDVEMMQAADMPVRFIETAVKPKAWARRVEPPTLVADLCQHDINPRLPSHHLGYVGSRYERDETIDKWIHPIANVNGHRAKFWGKWEPSDEVRTRWPGITFAGRIGVRDFYDAYSRVAAVPLLAKQSYYRSGFITPRVWEAVLFGSIPIGLAGHRGIGQYVERVAIDSRGLLEAATEIRNISSIRRRVLREEAAHRLSHMDARHFVDVLEGLVDAVAKDFESTAEVPETQEGTEHGNQE
jgi:hypothetical protein